MRDLRAWAGRRGVLPALALAALLIVPALLRAAVHGLSSTAPSSLHLLVLLVQSL